MDAEEEWDFHERFDFVHTRLMNGWGIRSWPNFYKQAFEHMQPGGWVENQEYDLAFLSDDGTVHADGALMRWTNLWNWGIANSPYGGSGRCYPDVMRRQMQEAGFINVQVRPYKLPIAPWPKDPKLRQAGAFFFTGFLDHISGLSMRVFTGTLGWSVEQMEVLLMEVRNECRQRSMHAYCPM